MYKVKVIIAILLLVDILLSVICLNLFKDKASLTAEKQSVKDDRLIEVLENNFKIGVYNDNSILDTTRVIHDLNKNEVGLSEILTDKPCLIIRFAETNCEECVRFLLIKVMRLYNFPYCFMLDSTMRTSHVFVPDKYEPQIANTYFELIENRYFK